MTFVIFGLSVSSSWGNGHATIWRGLIRELTSMGHKITFFEKNVQYYSSNRDLTIIEGMELILYENWVEVETTARIRLKNADVAIVTSYCPDAVEAYRLMSDNFSKLKIFYDMDTPVTLECIEKNSWPSYIPEDGLRGFDCVLSYTGGFVTDKLKSVLGADTVFTLYGCADPNAHYPSDTSQMYNGDISYLGTFAVDRQDKLVELFVEPARMVPEKRFILGGSLYPEDFPWTENIHFYQHIAPPDHSSFYCSSKFTLNITRGAMAENGYCPSGRLFEAAICGVAVISDWWEGLDKFFVPDEEILIAEKSQQVVQILEMNNNRRKKIAHQARKRCLSEHTAKHRAKELINIISKF